MNLTERASAVVRGVGAPRHREWWLVAGYLVVTQAVLFGGHWSGTTTIPWVFLGSYNAEAFAWWHDGSFFRPPEWMPYHWGGYPAAASIQNSAWYLPVGAIEAVGSFTIHAASALAALHVAWGALGAYVLVRRWIRPGAPALLALVAYTFPAAAFANAQHVDIARTTAWLPWLVLLASPRWPWRRWWSVPLAAVLLWQFALSAYPGVIVMAAYALVVAVVVWQVQERPAGRDFLLPFAVSGVAAVGLSLVKYLPAVALRGTEDSVPGSGPVLDRAMAATLFFPHDVDFLAMDVTMRPYFVVAPVVVLAALAPLRSVTTRAALALVGVPLLLGLPLLPWYQAVGSLPALGLSRFRYLDARIVVVLGVTVLAAAALDRLLRDRPPATQSSRAPSSAVPSPATSSPATPSSSGRPPDQRLRDRRRRDRPGAARAWLVAVPAIALWLGVTTPYTWEQWVAPWVVVTAAAAAAATVRPLPGRADLQGPVVALILLTAVSGVHWVAAGARTWQIDRVAVETRLWGATSGELIALREDVATDRRPAREPLPEGADANVTWAERWNRAYWDGTAAVAGRVNLKGQESFELIRAAVEEPGAAPGAPEFWAAPGVAIAPEAATDPAALARCVTDGACGPGLVVTATGYVPGEHGYRVVAETDTVVWFNEAHYPGWRVTVCGDGCRDLPVTSTDMGAVAATVPAGSWDLTLRYETPGQAAGWWCFGGGVVLAAVYPLLRRVRGRSATSGVP